MYSGFKYSFTSINGDVLSIEDKIKITDSLRQRQASELTSKERAYLLLDKIKNKSVTQVSIAEQAELYDVFCAEVMSAVNSRPELNLSQQDMTDIHTAIGDHVTGIALSLDPYSVTLTSAATYNPEITSIMYYNIVSGNYNFDNIQPQGE